MTLANAIGADPLARVVAARVKQTMLRLGLVVTVGGVFQFLSGWRTTLAWALIYAVQQGIEYLGFRDVSGAESLSSKRGCMALGSMFAGNTIFGMIGVAAAFHAGPWGLVCACLLWSSAVLNATMSSSGCRMALIATAFPPAAYFLSAPFFVAYNGAEIEYGLIVLLAGVLNTLAMVTIWSSSKTRLDAEDEARQVAHVALHDPETDLPNRVAFEREIAERREGEPDLVVAVLGIDRFSDLRGAIGYTLTTQLIQKVAARLQQVHAGSVARLSTSTLGVTFRAQDIMEARTYAAKLQSALAGPVRIYDNNVDVSLSIGLAADPSGNADSMLEHASIALDQAIRRKSDIAVFDAATYKNPASNLSLMSEMLRSIEQGEITNHYQPKYDLRSGKLVGVEALVRWRHPERGMIPPDTFIPMAEETGRIRELTIDVLSRAIRDQGRLAERGHVLSFAVNLSGRLLHDDEIAGKILEIVKPAAGKVSLEVTETSMMENPEKALAILHQLRSADIELSIDDYGSGLSSLAYLKNIPAHELKVDKAFVMHMDEGQRDAFLVRSTVALAHSLGLKVTAEGVETATALALLRSMNCDCAQGYYMSRPIPFEDLAALLARGGDIAINDQTSLFPKQRRG